MDTFDTPAQGSPGQRMANLVHLTTADAGLVTAKRRGREVLYGQTPLAAALLHPDPEIQD